MYLFGSRTEDVGVTAPMVRMCGEVLRVKRDSSLRVRCSRTLDTAVAALKMEGVDMDRSLETRLKTSFIEGR